MKASSENFSKTNSATIAEASGEMEEEMVLNKFKEITKGKQKLLERLVKSFITNSDETLAMIGKYPDSISGDELYEQVHKIKPVLDYLNFDARHNCINIKKGLKEPGSVDIDKEIEMLVRDLRATQKVLYNKFKI